MSLLDYCSTDRQREIIQAWYNHNQSAVEAAKSIGCGDSTFRTVLHNVRIRAAAKGFTLYFDGSRFVDEGHSLIGKSTLTKDDEGNTVWIKTKADQIKKDKAFRAFVQELCEGVKPIKSKPKTSRRKDELLSTIIIGDAHLGMRADSEETRDRNFDTNIASQEIKEAINELVERSPECRTGMLVQVGDFTHSDGSSPFTTKGTLVDVDTRFEKVMRVAAQTMIFAIDRMLTKCDTIQVAIARGNHDSDTALAVQLILEFYYSKEKRVNILKSKGFFHYLQWGKWLFGIHHGDKVKAAKLAQIMPRDMPAAWGESTHRLWFVGHFHHASVQEFEGVTVQKFGTLAPPDSWHSGQGYGSDHTMSMIAFKKDGGRHITCTYEIPKQYAEPDVKI